MPTIVRSVSRADYEQWLPLWDGYNAFYKRQRPDRAADRDHQDDMGALLRRLRADARAWSRRATGRLVGLVHYLFHRKHDHARAGLLPAGPVSPNRRCVARASARPLIEAVYEKARLAGSPRVLLAHARDQQDRDAALRLRRQSLGLRGLSQGPVTTDAYGPLPRRREVAAGGAPHAVQGCADGGLFVRDFARDNHTGHLGDGHMTATVISDVKVDEGRRRAAIVAGTIGQRARMVSTSRSTDISSERSRNCFFPAGDPIVSILLTFAGLRRRLRDAAGRLDPVRHLRRPRRTSQSAERGHLPDGVLDARDRLAAEPTTRSACSPRSCSSSSG